MTAKQFKKDLKVHWELFCITMGFSVLSAGMMILRYDPDSCMAALMMAHIALFGMIVDYVMRTFKRGSKEQSK